MSISSVFPTTPPVHDHTSRVLPICHITRRSFYLVLDVGCARPTTDGIIDNQNTLCPVGVKGRGISNVKPAQAVPSTVRLGLSVLEPVGRLLDEVPTVVGSRIRGDRVAAPKEPVAVFQSPSFTAGTCWNLFLALPVVANSAQSSDTFLPRHQGSKLIFLQLRKPPFRRTQNPGLGFKFKAHDAWKDASYEGWLATTERQYKRTESRNWLGSSIVRIRVYVCV